MTPIEAAHRYASMGWRVIPIRPGEKRPGMDRWVEVATTDHDKIEDWWSRWSNFGVGVVTGSPSHLFVVDVDEHDPAMSGSETLADLEATYGPLPETVECHTGSGGRHLYFTAPVEIRNDAGKRLGPGLDIRGEGGQVLAPPTIHPNGREYVWELEHGPDDCGVAEAPGWLVRLLTAVPDEIPRIERVPHDGPERPGDRFAAAVTWPELLVADGATFLGRRNSPHGAYEMWARPGTDHASATLYYGGTDLLKVFSSNWPSLTEGETYTRFGYFVATHYRGDYQRAAAELAAREEAEAIEALVRDVPRMVEEPETVLDIPLAPWLVDWPTAWECPIEATDWLLEPLIARGRGHALYAPAKTGKSLITLEAAAALATGRPFLSWPGGVRRHVLYMDYEMTLADLIERLTTFGYGPDDDLSHLHYILLPSIPTLDTADGALVLVQTAIALGCEWVIIDTMGRAVVGEEDKNDTYRAFYRATGIALKSAGIAYHRLDHAGKDLERGQRGASAKNDDVDVVQKLTKLDGGAMRLEATHRRMNWVPERIDLAQIEDELAGTMSHVIAEDILMPEGVGQIIAVLDRLDAPVDISFRAARELLKGAGEKVRNAILAKAVKHRKDTKGCSPTYSEALLRETFGSGEGAKGKSPAPHMRGTVGNAGNGTTAPCSPKPTQWVGERGAVPVPEPEEDRYY